MKSIRRYALAIVALSLLSSSSRSGALDLRGGSPDRGLGLGVILGEPTGFSLKYWLSDVSAVDAAVGWSFDGETDFHVHGDYLHHLFDLFPVKGRRLPLYFGGGLRYKHRDGREDLFGFRGVVGVSYLVPDIPLDIFLEAGPILDVTPDFEVRHTVGIGARYWF